MPGQDISPYADKAMFQAVPMSASTPKVNLLWMTTDPLGAIAAACRMYEGKPTYDLSEITERERVHYFDQAMATHLKAPLEFVVFHFFLEAVPRSFTHQQVRQRTAVFAQESMRFAVKDGFASEAIKPPGVVNAGDDIMGRWDEMNKKIEDFYNYMIANGVPAEDARDILPHCTATRLNYCTNLRNLADHAGNRLCTQAQFIWRKVFAEIVNSIRTNKGTYSHQGERTVIKNDNAAWQYRTIANSKLFRPVCYEKNNCPFKASFDRGCTIRGRVDSFAAAGVPSEEWDVGIGLPTYHQSGVEIIHPAEWLLDDQAGITR
jgi:flavin-dependent thymidylate synthase